MDKGFRQMLVERQKSAETMLCVGLDPLKEKVPSKWISSPSYAEGFRDWMIDVVKQTAPYAAMFKPQRAHWEAVYDGEEALRQVVKFIKATYPDIPVFLDCKRGDIARTQACYAEAHFHLDWVDGMNFSPYMGFDCMSALVGENGEYKDRGIVGLCYTSNPSARDIQDLQLTTGGKLWEAIANKVHSWSATLGIYNNAGLVMAAAYKYPGTDIRYSDHLKRCREIVMNDLWFLIPGVGTQGGYVEETVRAAWTGPGSIAINSSSGIIFADDPAEEARKLSDQMQAAIPI